MTTTVYRCFIASPSDTNEERLICDKVFNELNKGIGQIYNFRLDSLKWENDVRPSLGKEGQAIINEQIGSDYNIFVGIMYKKFGTPTNKAGSGTEEEFNNAYQRYCNQDNVEIMFYFNDAPPEKLSDINALELGKVNSFKSKMSSLGLYGSYNGVTNFEEKLRTHLTKYFIEQYKNSANASTTITANIINKEALRKIFTQRFNESLCGFTSQPIIWVEPVISLTNDISKNPDDNYNKRIELQELISNPSSTVIQAPPQFGLTSLANYFVKEAWEKDMLWIYLDSTKTKAHTIQNAVKNEAEGLGQKLSDVKCIVLDSWDNYEVNSLKKLKNLCDSHKDIPIFVMQTIDDSRFLQSSNSKEQIKIDRSFNSLHLLALPRTQIRKVVTEYNKAKGIGEDDAILAKVISDLELLNIHRTPYNCLTLLKVSEKYFDESPVNRTKMIEMVLFVLFDMDGIPKYKTKPDLKDCEYVLGRFCESLIRNGIYSFSRDSFLGDLTKFCKEKLFDIEVEVVFDVLTANNIIIKKEINYGFRSTFWIFYFAAKRMHSDKDFTDYIFLSKKYIAFPEIIEFYTGIDRNRTDALTVLTKDIRETCDIVFQKLGMPDNINPFAHTQWKPTEENIEKMQKEISDNVLNSKLPDEVKDQYADKTYNQIRPYNQSINAIFEQYSLHNLMQKIIASSRALRNSDYVDPELKREMLKEILRSWEQLSKVLFALAPILASNQRATFEGQGFELSSEDWGDTFEEKVNRIFQSNPSNVVGYFKSDLFSSKLGPLLFDQFANETNPLKKHHLALLITFERPREWKIQIENYIISLSKNSFFLYDIVNALRSKYRYDFVTNETLREIEYLIKMGLAKHHFGDKKPGLDKIKQITNQNLPKREYNDDEKQ